VAILLMGTFLTPLPPRMKFPVRDAELVSIDAALGFNVPAIMSWVQQHNFIRATLDLSYTFLGAFTILTILLPALAGKKQAAEQFLLANGVCSILSIPFSMLLPAIGPWVGFHFAGSPAQVLCEMGIRSLHANAHASVMLSYGSVTCPSFHAIWGILSAQALSSFRWLKPLAWPFAVLVMISTVTTGWHYAVDVLASILVATIAIWAARKISPSTSSTLRKTS